MTLPAQTAHVEYFGDDSVGPFTYDWRIDSAGEMEVRVDSTIQTRDVHYTLSGVGSQNGGNVTFTAGNEPVGGSIVAIRRIVDFDQLLDLVPNSALPAESVEARLDQLTKMMALINEEMGRTPTLRPGVREALRNLELPHPDSITLLGGGKKVFSWNDADNRVILREFGVADELVGLISSTLESSTHGGLGSAGNAGKIRFVTDQDHVVWVDTGSDWIPVGGYVPSITFASLPSPGTAGRIYRVTDNIKGLWFDDGSSWKKVGGYHIDARDFGVIGDDSVGSEAVNNIAFASANQALIDHGVGLYIPAGIYRVSESVIFGDETRQGIRVWGDGGQQTIFRGMDNLEDIIYLDSAHSTYADFGVTGGNQGIVCRRTSSSTLSRLTAKECGSHGIAVDSFQFDPRGNCNDMLFLNCLALENGGSGMGYFLGPDLWSNACTFIHCVAISNAVDGLSLFGQYHNVYGGDYSGNGGYGIRVSEDAEDHGEWFTIGCVVDPTYMEFNTSGGAYIGTDAIATKFVERQNLQGATPGANAIWVNESLQTDVNQGAEGRLRYDYSGISVKRLVTSHLHVGDAIGTYSVNHRATGLLIVEASLNDTVPANDELDFEIAFPAITLQDTICYSSPLLEAGLGCMGVYINQGVGLIVRLRNFTGSGIAHSRAWRFMLWRGSF